MKNLIAYFSPTGTTKQVATALAEAIHSDIYEIKPAALYTAEDLNWRDKKSRSSIEMKNKKFRPALAEQFNELSDYDTIFLGFPIWWYVAPTIINTFLEQTDLKGKKIVPFATSGGSDMGNTNKELAPSCRGAQLEEGRVFPADVTKVELKYWADKFIFTINDKKEFEKVNIFGQGKLNTDFAKYFIGDSYLNPLVKTDNGLSLTNVTFEPECRNNWHIHHAKTGGGQILICTAGSGWYQAEGEEPVSLTPGSTVKIPANVKHWHGAKKDSWFSHIAVEVPGEESYTEWLEPVKDSVYKKLKTI